MSPWSPTGTQPETTWDTLAKHQEYWNAPSNKKRKTTMIDATGNGKIIGNRQMSEELKQAFHVLGLPTSFNDPYAKSEEHHPFYIADSRGVSLDVLKDQLVGEPGEEYHLEMTQPSERKITTIADILHRVLQNYLR